MAMGWPVPVLQRGRSSSCRLWAAECDCLGAAARAAAARRRAAGQQWPAAGSTDAGPTRPPVGHAAADRGAQGQPRLQRSAARHRRLIIYNTRCADSPATLSFMRYFTRNCTQRKKSKNMCSRVCHQSQCKVPIGNYLAPSMWKQYGAIYSSLILTLILPSAIEVWHISVTQATLAARWWIYGFSLPMAADVCGLVESNIWP